MAKYAQNVQDKSRNTQVGDGLPVRLPMVYRSLVPGDRLRNLSPLAVTGAAARSPPGDGLPVRLPVEYRSLIPGDRLRKSVPSCSGRCRDAVAASEALLARGYYVTAIRPPTVPAGTSRLRVTLSAAHDESQVDGLVVALAEVLPAARA